ncbi:MAG: CYTH domain-containing protein [Spirochaetales bacterium]|nr:CYTH domain-containing protein [Spirochaetales bacterium]
MAYEIELKAHVSENQLDDVRSAISALPEVKALGPINKFDMYWSQTEDGDPLFRTRREASAEGSHVLFTAKPNKTRTADGTEENQELEFTAPDSQWDNILTFCSGLGLQVCRLKWKKGSHYHVCFEDYDIHVELLNVKYLGWFVEMEICPPSLEGFDVAEAHKVLRDLLSSIGVSEDAIEHVGYNKLLKAIGHDKG